MAFKSSSVFTGGSGQMAVIAELLLRQCNAAIPHVDVGMDVFAFKDDREEVARIQVKTAKARPLRRTNTYAAAFGIPLEQLKRSDAPPLHYAMAARLNDRWGNFLVISRSRLQVLWNDGCGSENPSSGNLELHIRFVTDDFGPPSVSCGSFNLARYLDAWETLPPLRPPVSIGM